MRVSSIFGSLSGMAQIAYPLVLCMPRLDLLGQAAYDVKLCQEKGKIAENTVHGWRKGKKKGTISQMFDQVNFNHNF